MEYMIITWAFASRLSEKSLPCNLPLVEMVFSNTDSLRCTFSYAMVNCDAPTVLGWDESGEGETVLGYGDSEEENAVSK